MKIFKFTVLASFLVFAGNLYADISNYNYLELEFANLEHDDADIDVDADNKVFGVGLEINDMLYFSGEYLTLEVGNSSQDILGLGLGVQATSGKTNYHAEFLLINVESGSEDDNGYRLNLGVRHMVSDLIELGGDLSHLDAFDDTESMMTLGARAHFNESFSARLFYRDFGDWSGFGVSGKLNF